MSHMASMELAVIITVPLAVFLVALLLTVYFVYRWSCCRVRGGVNHWSFWRAVGVADSWNCCSTRGREGNDEENNIMSDLVTPEAIIPEGKNYLL